MHKDIEVIVRLKKRFGIRFKRLDGSAFQRQSFGYRVQEDGRVSHLKLSEGCIDDLTLLTSLKSLTYLALDRNQIKDLTPLSSLTSLTWLNLDRNQINDLAPLASLKTLNYLRVGHNQINDLTPLASLESLTNLWLQNNQIQDLAPLSSMKSITWLDLDNNQIQDLIPLASMMAMTSLRLSNNQIQDLAPLASLNALSNLWLQQNQINDLAHLTPLEALKQLHLSNNQINDLVPITSLNALIQLSLLNNQIQDLTPLASLTALTYLHLSGNQIIDLAPIGSLAALTTLKLSRNQIEDLAPLVSLTNLTNLTLSYNNINDLAPLENLIALKRLDLRCNPLKLICLPPENARTQNIIYSPKDLIEVPNEIIAQGKVAICSYSMERAQAPQRWVSKLVVVGEGGTGKTSLLRRLHGLAFQYDEQSTHGIRLDHLPMPHPNGETTMTLFTWDFGGQHIYHATHQFFLTQGALILVAWNARLGYAQGRVEYWLENIRARAPGAPVLLVVTHVDQRRPDIPLKELQRRFPNLTGQVAFSSKDDTGLKALKDTIAAHAAQLPLMGERWPQSWSQAAEHLRCNGNVEPVPSYLLRERVHQLFIDSGLENEEIHVFLARWMHELGEILWFLDDPELNDLVILDPQWVTLAISRILESETVAECRGLLSRAHLRELWHDIDPCVHDHLLNLMDRFDLSYPTTGKDRDSLVVELLPFEPPAFQEPWAELEAVREIRLHLQLKTSMPPGIPTWFIARLHRFSMDLHWRQGVLLRDKGCLGLIQASPERRTVTLAARGVNPWPFFSQIRDALDETLDRYPGLAFDRLIPCPGHDDGHCLHFFKLDQVERAEDKGSPSLQCPESLEMVDVGLLLYGLSTRAARLGARRDLAHTKPQTPVDELVYGQRLILEKLQQMEERDLQMVAMLQRQYLRQYRALQGMIENRVPNIFSLRPTGTGWLPERLNGQEVALQLYCQYPGYWHTTGETGCYTFKLDPDWLKTVKPLIHELNRVLKFVFPAVAVGVTAGLDASEFQAEFKLMDGLAKCLKQMDGELENLDEKHEMREIQQVEGVALRQLRQLLKGLDEQEVWGGLRPLYTPEGEILWLCEEHYRCY